MVQRVEVKALVVGQHRIASDVLDVSGRLLLTAGTLVDERQRRVLLTWGIAAVDVMDEHNASAEPEATPSAPSCDAQSDSDSDNRDDPAASLPDPRNVPAVLAHRFALNDLECPLIRRLYLAAERECNEAVKAGKKGVT